MLSSKHSFRLLSKEKPTKTASISKQAVKSKIIDKSELESDSKKRSFLKLAGVVGAGVVASQLLPKKADALIFGSQPGGGSVSTVGVKNVSGDKINPATEDTLAGIKGKTDQLTFDSGASPGNLNVNVTAGSVGLKNTGGLQVNPATEDTLAAIRSKTDLLQFSGSSLLTSVGGTGNVVGVKDTTNTQINPATDESLIYLRRMVKLMESQATVDASNRQRVVVDSFGAVVTGAGPGGAGVPRVTVANDSAFTTNITALNGWGDQMFTDPARTAYAVGIRANLSW